jgi:hypothetical protein
VSSNPFSRGAKAFGYTGSEEPTDYWATYEAPGQKSNKGPLPKGRYTFRVPEPGENFFPEEKKGDRPVTFLMHATVVGPADYAGRTVNYIRFSTQKYPWRDGSMAGDLLLACGIDAKPRTPDEWFSIAPFLANKLFDGDVELYVRDKEAGQTIWRRAADLPTKADGSPMTIIVLRNDGTPVQDCGDPVQQRQLEEAAIAAGGKKLFANNDIKGVYPPA